MLSLHVPGHILRVVRAACNSLYIGAFIDMRMLPLRMSRLFCPACLLEGPCIPLRNLLFYVFAFSAACPVAGFRPPPPADGGARKFRGQPSLPRTGSGAVSGLGHLVVLKKGVGAGAVFLLISRSSI